MIAAMRLAGFAFSTLLPGLLLAIGAFAGGGWLWAGVASIALVWLFMDPISALAPGETDDGPGGDELLVLLGLVQLAFLPLAIWVLTMRLQGTDWSGTDWLAALVGFGLFFGQIGNPAAHELIHRPARGLRALGVAVYTGFLFGHHASAHRLVHHVHVGTDRDPNSARRGRGFWRFVVSAWIGSFRAGWRAEQALRARASAPRANPYALYVGGALALMTLTLALAGWRGLVIYLILAAHTQSQLLVADYVQHYGLRRAAGADGRPEPVGPQHSWNATGWYSSAMMLNAPRHSDHHAHPMRPYPRLRLPPGAPMLPAPLPAMALVALVPPVWRRIMDPRLPDASVTPT